MRPSYLTPQLDRLIPYTQNFYWREALYCHRWDSFVIPTRQIHENICKTARVLQRIRSYYGEPVTVTSWYRPKKYNILIKGAEKSAHMEGLAVDFVVRGKSAHEVQQDMKIFLDEWDIRMEDNSPKTWTHIDLFKPKPNRYFKP